jgi:hypothetical protein
MVCAGEMPALSHYLDDAGLGLLST